MTKPRLSAPDPTADARKLRSLGKRATNYGSPRDLRNFHKAARIARKLAKTR